MDTPLYYTLHQLFSPPTHTRFPLLTCEQLPSPLVFLLSLTRSLPSGKWLHSCLLAATVWTASHGTLTHIHHRPRISVPFTCEFIIARRERSFARKATRKTNKNNNNKKSTANPHGGGTLN